jgi:hemerythrin-like domain-containing protein
LDLHVGLHPALQIKWQAKRARCRKQSFYYAVTFVTAVLNEEHRWAAPLHAEVDRLGAQYLATGNLSSSDVDDFRKAVASLASMYKQHINVEDSLVFPLAARVLSNSEKMAIAEEMAIRRRVRLVTELS